MKVYKRHKVLLLTFTCALSLVLYISKPEIAHIIEVQNSRQQLEVCSVSCRTGHPCEYKSELDFRIIVITYNRHQSLNECLTYVATLDTMGDRVGVDIWIDRSKQGNVDQKVKDVAEMFVKTWKHGPACVHVQDRNALIIGQWIDTWRPKINTNEMALILEDDIDLSPHAYRWLKSMKGHFRYSSDIAGYCLQMEDRNIVATGRGGPITGPKTDSIFLYKFMCSWGYSPEPRFWRRFQDWFHEQSSNKSFHPYVKGIIPTNWYKNFEKKGTQHNMWSMWFMYFCDIHNMFTVSSNLKVFANRSDVLLDTNRREKGLHFNGRSSAYRNGHHLLLKTWNNEYGVLPKNVLKYGYDGKVIEK